MREITPSWRWIPATVAALILSILLATIAARFYPPGDLDMLITESPYGRPLQIMPEFEILTDAQPDPTPDDPAPPEPEPRPEIFGELWSEWIAGRTLKITCEPQPRVLPQMVPDLDWSALAATEPDTSQLGLLARTMMLRNELWEDHKLWAVMGLHAKRAARYQAMKASVFNEDWLEKEHFKQ